MSYSGKIKGVPSEMASKIGHLSVIEDEFVQELLKSFEIHEENKKDFSKIPFQKAKIGNAATKVICVDGSFAIVPHAIKDHKKLAYIKIAALGLDIEQLEKANKVIVNPEVVRTIISEYATTESTVLPLENVTIHGQTLKDTLRKSIFKTFEKLFNGKIIDTLVYLLNRGWDEHYVPDAHFNCPFCETENNLPKNKVFFKCKNPQCSSESLSIVDYLGFLSQTPDDNSDEKIATDLMLILEHLTLFYYLKELISNNQNLEDYLILKDGPLLLSGQYSRLVEPMRAYFEYLKSINKIVNFVGVEKNGTFVNHIPEIKEGFKEVDQIFIPSNQYIFEKIKYSTSNSTLYGERVLYGSKLFYCPDKKNVFVLTIPIGAFDANPSIDHFIGLPTVLATIKRLQSHRYDSGLAPIVAVNSIASMSFHPSNNILSKFSDHFMKKTEGV